MKIEVDLDPSSLQETVKQIAYEQAEEIIKMRVRAMLEDKDGFWDVIDEGLDNYVNSDSFVSLIRRVIRESETELVETIHNRLIQPFE